MNKQQLASKIWEAANKMRSKIEANEYKDYILGFIFYKFLSDKEVEFLTREGWTKEDLQTLVEEDAEIVKYCQDNNGYFIAYDNLFSTWLEMGSDFKVQNVTVALSAFTRLIKATHKKVFDKIFNTLETGLSKLGESDGARTKAISDLIQLIRDIPMDSKQGYDVLGFIYEYLISNFAANAGKKAGEFYTPHEVSLLMSEIIAEHLNGRDKIEIYDPTSGSGSLLINIGHAVSKRMSNKNNIKYYAQELKENTYNLTRMNLVMRGILPDNICTRNGDTLEEDWPCDDVNEPLYVDAVVSNPPYSQPWDPTDRESDLRYKRFGLAPKAKADYAFLLHDLYHIKPDGIMTIVLPHGVLFRGGEEEKIRTNLIEENHIDAIIGLPANIFFGTGIPTIIMVLKQHRDNSDVLIIDASKGFEKVGKNNQLRASDIKRIVDTVIARKDVPKFAKVVSKQTIRDNGYNLNIPRYVDSSEKGESWDIYASIFGGIPKAEIDELGDYWTAFPNLKGQLFAESPTPYSDIVAEDINKTIYQNSEVVAFVEKYRSAFADFADYLNTTLVENSSTIAVPMQENIIADNIFARLANIPLIDKYDAYQLLHNAWITISQDLEMIQTEGFAATKKVDPKMVVKKEKGKEVEVQDGWVGHIIPFEVVQSSLLKAESDAIKATESRLAEIGSELAEILDSLSEDEIGSGDLSLTNDDNDAFVAKNVSERVKLVLADITSDEINALESYMLIGKKKDKLAYIQNCNIVDWSKMDLANDGTYSKGAVKSYILTLKQQFEFSEDSIEYKVVRIADLLEQEKSLKKELKALSEQLHATTKKTIEGLTDEQAKEMLRLKWIAPLCDAIAVLPDSIVRALESAINALAKKYLVTMLDVESQIEQSEREFANLIDELEGDEFDMLGLQELQKLLRGE